MDGALNFNLHPKQGAAFNSAATEILYGGAAGGGKSHLIRVAPIIWCTQIPGLQVYLFRRVFPDLLKNHMEGPKGFRSILAPWIEAKLIEIVPEEIRFTWNGSKIYLCHCQHEKDRFKFQGAEMHVLLIDELTHFTETIYRFLRSRVRTVGLNLPDSLKDKFPRILCASNPGNIGHTWVKAMFVDPRIPMAIDKTEDDEGGMFRQFIPAKLDDNPSMIDDDPSYDQRLSGLGSPQLVRAMRDGDWNAVVGAYFPEFNPVHVIKPFTIPDHWTRFRALDWGSAKPFSVGWYTVSDGTLDFPKNALIKYREWYGKSTPNVGLKLHVHEVAHGILSREDKEEKISYSIADPSIFKQDGGPSIAEQFSQYKVFWRGGDNSRIAGWQQIRNRLVGLDDAPMLYFFETCLDTLRTLPVSQHDEHKPEDLDTEGEDHALDELRYACMSRPFMHVLKAVPKMRGCYEMTLDELYANEKRVMARGRRSVY